MFDLLLDAGKIDQELVDNMRSWKHSGFSVDNTVCIKANDHTGMQRLVEYISRCPFSLSRMVSLTKDGKVLYRASKAKCFKFPVPGDNTLLAGTSRNFETFEVLDFLTAVTQHIPNNGEHQIRYYDLFKQTPRSSEKKMPGTSR